MNAEQLNLLKINLSEAEQKDYISKGDEFVKGMIEHELGGEEDGWELSHRRSNGTSCFLKYMDNNPICLVKGVAECDGDVQDLKKAMMHIQTSELFREEMTQLDPMFTGGALLYNHFVDEDNLLQVFYSNFSLAPGDLVWDRDMLFIQYTALLLDEPRNQRVCVAACGSVERDDFPSMSHLKRCRALIQNTGYIFREIGPNRVRITYVVQVDPRGFLPPWVVNISAKSQAENTTRMVLRVHDSYKACRSMGVAPMSCEVVQVHPKKTWTLRVNPFDPNVGYQEPNDLVANRTQSMGMDASNDSQLLSVNFISTADNLTFKIEGLHLEDAKGMTQGAGKWVGEKKLKSGRAYNFKLRLRRTESILFQWSNRDYFRSSLFFFKVEVLENEPSVGPIQRDEYVTSEQSFLDMDESFSSNSSNYSSTLSSRFYAQKENFNDSLQYMRRKAAVLLLSEDSATLSPLQKPAVIFAPTALFIMFALKMVGLLDASLFALLATDVSLISAVGLLVN